MDSLSDDILTSLGAAVGLNVTLYDPCGCLMDSGYAALPRERCIHSHPFCCRVKTKQESHCIRCDNLELFPLCLERKDAFPRTCHAGATEIIIPVIHRAQLVSLAFLGPFRTGSGSDLPLLTPEAVVQALHLGTLLQCYLGTLVRDSRENRRASSREAAIRGFMREGISRDLRLPDLARSLHLSPSRTRHIVKEVCGLSFSELKDEVRLEVAMELLRTSNSRLGFIALQAGFPDPDYFSRFFRKKTGQAPSHFRKTMPV